MPTAAFLTAINVGGRRLGMADLRVALEGDGLGPVETVLASGNLVLEREDGPSLGQRIAASIERRFGFRTVALVRNRAQVREAIEGNPFFGSEASHSRVHTHFLERDPDPQAFAALVEDQRTKGGERLAMGPRCLYIDYVDGVGSSKLTAAAMERRLGCAGTARNMRTLARVLALLP